MKKCVVDSIENSGNFLNEKATAGETSSRLRLHLIAFSNCGVDWLALSRISVKTESMFAKFSSHIHSNCRLF